MSVRPGALALAMTLALTGAAPPVQQAPRMVLLDVHVDGPGRVVMPDGRFCGPDSRCSEPLRRGTRIRLKAMQEHGVDGRFRGWDGACRGNRTPECGGPLRADARVIARFTR